MCSEEGTAWPAAAPSSVCWYTIPLGIDTRKRTIFVKFLRDDGLEVKGGVLQKNNNHLVLICLFFKRNVAEDRSSVAEIR